MKKVKNKTWIYLFQWVKCFLSTRTYIVHTYIRVLCEYMYVCSFERELRERKRDRLCKAENEREMGKERMYSIYLLMFIHKIYIGEFLICNSEI